MMHGQKNIKLTLFVRVTRKGDQKVQSERYRM